jgi:hypothetical protein
MQNQARQMLKDSYNATDAAFEIVLKEVARLAVEDAAPAETSQEIRSLLSSDSWLFAEAEFRLAA